MGNIMHEAQARTQALIDDFIARDIESGLQVAAYHNGEQIVDAWGGTADATTRSSVDGDTLFTVWSVTKGISATAIHILADRGILDYDTPVARYWPEFAVNGKEQITLRQLLAHTAGLPQMPDGTTAEDTCDWELMTGRLAELAPAWEPGTAMGYHALTYGWLVGEVGRRADGRPFAQIVQDEICRPLGIDSLFLGIPDEVEPRVAMLEAAPPPAADQRPPLDSLVMRSIGPLATMSGPEWANRPDVRRACIPGAGGIMNARAIARIYAALASSEVDGVRLLTPERIRQASALQYEGPDVMAGGMHRKALGYHVGDRNSTMSERLACFGHAGAGGSYGFADPEYGLSFGICKTRMVDAAPGADAATIIARAIRECLRIPEA
jgi:CubicO group peptidase (beta-lactamase class C family)